MRLFTGISLPQEVLDRLGGVLAELHETAELNWSVVDNLHITTKFIGEWPESRLDELKGALAAAEASGPIDIRIARFGYYPNPHKPRVLFAGVHAGPELPALAHRIDEACAGPGCQREERPYSPHVTLGKIRNAPIGSLRERIAAMDDQEFGSFTAREFHLYLSTSGLHGSVYTKIASYPLA